MNSKKKQAAAIAAVVSYLNTEQEAVAVLASAVAASDVEHPPGARLAAPPLKVWGISGRQVQMQMRNMMQMKTFK
jgi:hypothetical protein